MSGCLRLIRRSGVGWRRAEDVGTQVVAGNAKLSLDCACIPRRYRPSPRHPLIDKGRGRIDAATKGSLPANQFTKRFDCVHMRTIALLLFPVNSFAARLLSTEWIASLYA